MYDKKHNMVCESENIYVKGKGAKMWECVFIINI